MSALPFSAAAERNREPILAVVREALVGCRGVVLEIGAGTGQHAEYFAPRLPWLTWLPSDRAEVLPALGARCRAAGQANLLAPIEIDVDRFGEVPDIAAAYTANTLHILPWSSGKRLLREVGRRLPAGGRFIAYGPFNVGGAHTSEGNARFDATLRRQPGGMGLRDRETVCREADRAGMSLIAVHAMPANNQTLVFERRA